MVISEREDRDVGRVRQEELRAALGCPSTGSGVGLPGFKLGVHSAYYLLMPSKRNLSPKPSFC